MTKEVVELYRKDNKDLHARYAKMVVLNAVSGLINIFLVVLCGILLLREFT